MRDAETNQRRSELQQWSDLCNTGVTRSCCPPFLVQLTSIFFPLMRSSHVCVSNSMVSISMVRRIFTFCAVDEPVDDVCCTFLKVVAVTRSPLPRRLYTCLRTARERSEGQQPARSAGEHAAATPLHRGNGPDHVHAPAKPSPARVHAQLFAPHVLLRLWHQTHPACNSGTHRQKRIAIEHGGLRSSTC